MQGTRIIAVIIIVSLMFYEGALTLDSTRAVQTVSDLNFFHLNKSSTGSVLHCGYGGDIYAHA